MGLLKKGNTKLGDNIWTFSIPAIETCPNRTKLCESGCYTLKGPSMFRSVRNSRQVSYEASKSPDFVKQMNKELSRKRGNVIVRIHVEGDFYSLDYIAAWTQIITDNQNHKFFMFTRQWRDSKFLPFIQYIDGLPNAEIFASVDAEIRDLGEVPPAWMRVADIVNTWEEMDNGDYTDFIKCANQKAKDRLIEKGMGRGQATKETISCSECTYCFKPAGKRKRSVAFHIH
jgi:hypothetical protein